MKSTITINVTPKIKSQLNRISRKENVNRSEIVRDALKQYFDRQEFRELRREMLVEAEKKGIYSVSQSQIVSTPRPLKGE